MAYTFVDLFRLGDLTHDELVFVVFHEVGHFVNGDLDREENDTRLNLNKEIAADLYSSTVVGKETAVSALTKLKKISCQKPNISAKSYNRLFEMFGARIAAVKKT